MSNAALVDALNALLPQTQCQRCGFQGCLPYAQAMAEGQSAPNRCPPGGVEGMQQLARTLGVAEQALDEACGPVAPRTKASIRADLCIGCTKCIDVCPTDAIVGAPKRLHFVIEAFCTGCDLCLPLCPVDCIDMVAIEPEWQAWPAAAVAQAKERYDAKQRRSHCPTSAAALPPAIAASPVESTLESALDAARRKAKERLAKARGQQPS